MERLHDWRQSGIERLRPVWTGLAANALFSHARREKPLPMSLLRWLIPIAAAVLVVLSLLAWLLSIRILAAGLYALTLAMVALPLLMAPLLVAMKSATTLTRVQESPATLDADTLTRGLWLRGAWSLRWYLVVALIATPALMIAVLRADLSDFAAFRSTQLALGAASAAGSTANLLPGGRLPILRLISRAVSAGFLPWVLLPLLIGIGVTAALHLDDASLGGLAALLSGGAVTLITLLAWQAFTRSTGFVGTGELVRAIVLLLGGAGYLAGAFGLLRWHTGMTANR